MDRLNISNNNNQNRMLFSFTTDKQDIASQGQKSAALPEIYMSPSFNILPVNISNFNLQRADNEFNRQNLDVFKCLVCLHIANNPVCCQSCQALVCTKCFSTSKTSNPNFSCKKCNSIFTNKNLTFNLQNDLNNLKLKCPNSGCAHNIPYVELKKHLELCHFTERQSECRFCKTILKNKTINNNNNNNVNSKEMQEHLSKCVLAMILCEYCNLYFLRNTLTEHKKYCQRQYESPRSNNQLSASHANINFAHSQQNINYQNHMMSSNNNLNSLRNKCPGCNFDLPLSGSYASKPTLCARCLPGQNQRPVGAYEAQSFYQNKPINNDFSNLSSSNLANSFSAKTFYGVENKNYYPDDIYKRTNYYNNNNNNNNLNPVTNNNNNAIKPPAFGNHNPNVKYISNTNNNNNTINNNNNSYLNNTNTHDINNNTLTNNNYLLNSTNNVNFKIPAYSNLNISNINVSHNFSRMGNDRYILDSDRSHLGNNNDYLVSMENFHKQNQSEIKSLLKNKELEISQIKRDYESKINAIINTNMDQNQMAKKHLIYEDSPLTLNDLRIDAEPDNLGNLNSKKVKNGIESGGSGNKNNFNNDIINLNSNLNTENNAVDKDMSMVEYSFFKHELEKLEDKNFANANKTNKNMNKDVDAKSSLNRASDFDKNNNLNILKESKEKNSNNVITNNENLLNDDFDAFEFSDNQGSFIKTELSPEELLNYEEKEALNAKKLSNRKSSAAKDDKASSLNLEVMRSLHNLEKEKMKKEHEKDIGKIKQEYLQQISDFMQTIKGLEESDNPLFNRRQFFEEVFAEIKKTIFNKEQEISNFANLQGKYVLLFNENLAVKEHFDKTYEKLKQEKKNLKLKNDEKLNEMKEEKQKEIVKIIENNENTILKIKANYENLISLIRKEKDSDIKKLVAKYESDFNQVKSKHESSVETMKKEYKNQLEIIKKNFELKDRSLKEKHDLEVKSLMNDRSEISKANQDVVFSEVLKSFGNLKEFVLKISDDLENKNDKGDENNELNAVEDKENKNEINNENDEANKIEDNKINNKAFNEFMVDLSSKIEKEIQGIYLLKGKFDARECERQSKKIEDAPIRENNTINNNKQTINPINNENKKANELDMKEISAKLEKHEEKDALKNNVSRNNNESEKVKDGDKDMDKENTKKKGVYAQTEDNNQYSKIIENYENNLHERKKNFANIILKSLNNTIADLNNTQNPILTEEKEKKETENSLSKSNNATEIKEMKKNNRTVSNGEKINLTEIKIANNNDNNNNNNLDASFTQKDSIDPNNAGERIKLLEKNLNELSAFLEEISDEYKKKIEVLISKSQLEINKINTTLFIDNGKSECDKKEKVKQIKQKIEAEITRIKDFHAEKEKEIQMLKADNKASNGKESKFFDFGGHIKNQIKSISFLKENYLSLKAENDSESHNSNNNQNDSISGLNSEQYIKNLSEKLSKLVNNENNSNSAAEKETSEKTITDGIINLIQERISEVKNNYEMKLTVIGKNNEKEKDILITEKQAEIAKVKAHYESLIEYLKEQTDKKIKEISNEFETKMLSERNSFVVTDSERIKKIEECEEHIKKCLSEKNDLEEYYLKKIDQKRIENESLIRNIKLNKDAELNQITASFKNEMDNLKRSAEAEKTELQSSHERKIDLMRNEAESLRSSNARLLDEMKTYYNGVIQLKDNEIRELKSVSENDLRNLKNSCEASIANINSEHQRKMDMIVKNFEAEIFAFKSEFASKLENLQKTINEKVAENALLKQMSDKSQADLQHSEFMLREIEASKNEEINQLKIQNESDIKNIAFSYKQKIDSINLDNKIKTEKLHEAFQTEKAQIQVFYEEKISTIEKERKADNDYLMGKYEKDFLLFKQQYEKEFDKIAHDQKNEIKEVLEKSFLDISSLKQNYENKLKNVEVSFMEKIENLKAENQQLSRNYEHSLEILNLEKQQILNKIGSLLNSIAEQNKYLSINFPNNNNNLVNESVQNEKILFNIFQDLERLNIKHADAGGKTNGFDNYLESENKKNLLIIQDLENALRKKNEEINTLVNEIQRMRDAEKTFLTEELEKMNKFYLEEINKLKLEANKNEEIIINNKNMEMQHLKLALDEYLKEEKIKIISEYENRIQMILQSNNNNNFNNNSGNINNSDEDLILFKDLLNRQLKTHYDLECCKLKELHSKEIAEERQRKMQALEMLKKENQVLISNLKETHQKEIEAIIGIKEQNSDIKDENDFKERILIDYLKEKFTLNCDSSDPPSLVLLAYNVLKGIEKNRNKTDLICTKNNKFIPGYGISFYENGEIYEGEISDSLPHGFGILYRIKLQRLYEGFFEAGKKSGKGSMQISEAQHYEGDFRNNQFHGKGTLISHGNHYNGDFAYNEKHGIGKLIYSSGERYEGHFKNDQRTGKGILYKTNGETYDGQWIDDIRKGNGVLIYPNGCRLIGMWNDELNSFEGKFHGNPQDLNEFNICRISNEKLVEKSDKLFDKDSRRALNCANEDVKFIEYKGKKFELVLSKFSA